MNRFTASAIILLCSVCAPGGLAATPPNIVFILTDDQGYGDIHAHGHPELKTPTFDLLFKTSVRFDDFSVSPTCSPTRCALMTGAHEWRSGVTHTRAPRCNLRTDVTILPQILKTAGYATGVFGKWHLGTDAEHLPGARGFDEYSLGEGPGANRALFDPSCFKNGDAVRRTGYRTDLFYADAIDFIKRHHDESFFCYIPSYSPHTPLGAPKPDTQPYIDAGLAEKTASFFGMIANLDRNIARVLSTLDECGIRNNTLVVVINDNGGTMGIDTYNAGMRGTKATAYWGGVRALSFWHWPGTLLPNTRHEMAAHIDVLPTLCAIAGVAIPATVRERVEGVSLLPLLKDTADDYTPWNDRVLVTHRGRWQDDSRSDAEHHRYSMVSLRWRHFAMVSNQPCTNEECKSPECLVTKNPDRRFLYTNNQAFHLAATNGWRLYDLSTDANQSHDISADFPGIVERLTRHYGMWWEDIITGVYGP